MPHVSPLSRATVFACPASARCYRIESRGKGHLIAENNAAINAALIAALMHRTVTKRIWIDLVTCCCVKTNNDLCSIMIHALMHPFLFAPGNHCAFSGYRSGTRPSPVSSKHISTVQSRVLTRGCKRSRRDRARMEVSRRGFRAVLPIALAQFENLL